MRRLEGKTAVITGCNRGIGKAILEKFASEGANVIACTRNVSEYLVSVYREIESEHGVQITPIEMDLSDTESINMGIKAIYALKKTIDILVNNAGIASFDGIMKLNHSKLLEIFQINYFSNVQLIQGLIMLLMRSKSASIINMSSIAGFDGTVGNTAYGASKASVALMTKCVSKELSKLKIRINAIAPGYIDTDMQKEITATVKDCIVNNIAQKRWGSSSEVAELAVFLASEESSYINGQTIRIDGGI